VIGVAAKAIFGYMHLFDPQFVSQEDAIGVGQACFAVTNGFDLGAKKLNTSRISVQYEVVE
jgi:hypothetical protein